MTQGAGKSMQILLVEDELDARKAIAQFLEGRGHRVRTAGNAREAYSAAAAAPPDIVVCDWRLGHDDGARVVRRLQQSSDCIAIFLTADSLTELRTVAADLHVHCFLRKPVTLERIASEVENAR